MTITDRLKTPHPEDRMSKRARGYMAVTAGRNTGLGMVLFLAPETFRAKFYAGVIAMLDFLPGEGFTWSLTWWGIIYLLVGAVCVFAAFRGEAAPARWALLLSLVVTGSWVWGFLVSLMYGEMTAPSALVVWVALVFKDSLMLGDPLRVPFEDAVARLKSKGMIRAAHI